MSSFSGLTDLLAELDQFHFCWHVSHSPHAFAKVLTADETILVLVKLSECLTQLCGNHAFLNVYFASWNSIHLSAPLSLENIYRFRIEITLESYL